jgi:hypothetical protein
MIHFSSTFMLQWPFFNILRNWKLDFCQNGHLFNSPSRTHLELGQITISRPFLGRFPRNFVWYTSYDVGYPRYIIPTYRDTHKQFINPDNSGCIAIFGGIHLPNILQLLWYSGINYKSCIISQRSCTPSFVAQGGLVLFKITKYHFVWFWVEPV